MSLKGLINVLNIQPPENKGASTSNQPDLGDYCLINSDKQQLRRIFDAFICLPLPHVQVAIFAVLIALNGNANFLISVCLYAIKFSYPNISTEAYHCCWQVKYDMIALN